MQRIQLIQLEAREVEELIERAVRAANDESKNLIGKIEEELYVNREWLTENQAAKYLGISKQSVQGLRRGGDLKAKRRGKYYYYHINELKRYIAEGDD